MRTPDGRLVARQDLSEVYSRPARKADNLLKRRTERPAAKPVAAGGGVVDQAEIWATNGSVRMLAGEGNLDYFNVRYDAPYRVQDNEVPDWVTVDGAEPWRLHLTPGWYHSTMFIRLMWTTESGAPAGFGPYMGGGWDAAHNDYSLYPRMLTATGYWGLATYVNFGPFFHHAEDDLHAEVRPVGPIGATTDSTLGTLGFIFTRLSGVDWAA